MGFLHKKSSLRPCYGHIHNPSTGTKTAKNVGSILSILQLQFEDFAMKKVALFAFNGEFMCFIHVLLNALDMKERGYEVKIVIEGSATKLVPELANKENPMFGLWEKVGSLGLLEGACKACSNKMGVLDKIKALKLALLDDISGHPSMAKYMENGFDVITF